MSPEIGYLEGSRVAAPVAKAADDRQYPLTEGCLSRLPLLDPWLGFKSICRIQVSHCIQTTGELLGDPGSLGLCGPRGEGSKGSEFTIPDTGRNRD